MIQALPVAPPAPHCEERFRHLIRRRTGILLHDHQMEGLRRTIVEACRRFAHPDCETYLRVLERSPASAPEYEHLVAGITVGESYFFRDRTQVELLRAHWIPRWVQRRRAEGHLTLRAWSAGCSDGQELYTLAMLLAEAIPDIDAWSLHLLGTDINIGALSRAVRGRYSEWSLRATDDARRHRYFTPSANQWVIDPALRARVRFSYLNLSEDSFPSILSETNAMDLILCRNVFIYFHRDVVREVMAKLAASLVPGGCLLLGASDLIDTEVPGLSLHRFGETFYLLREGGGAPPEPLPAAPEPFWEDPPPPPRQRAAQAPRPLSPEVEPFADIVERLRREDWSGALELADALIERGDDGPLPWQFRAKCLANLGRAREALHASDRSLGHAPMDKHTHFLRALVLQELGRLPEAERALRRTLYLARDFLEAHYHLGMLLLRRGQRAAGLKSLENALRIAESRQPERELHNAGGMTYGRMVEILRGEIGMYGRKTHPEGLAP